MANKPSCDTELMRKRTTIFESNEKEDRVYRIPALFYDREKKILLAFAEKRRTKDDAHTLALVMKRGTVNEDKTVTFEDPERELVKKANCGPRPMNPCPVYDKISKTLFLFFIFVKDLVREQWQVEHYNNKAHLCYIKSPDAGKSWSEVIHVSEYLDKMKDWATFAVGPGHGLQTHVRQTHGGKLIVPVHGFYSSCRCRYRCRFFTCRCARCLENCHSCCYSKCCSPTQYALSLYSEDQGNTWKFGRKLQTNSGECEMAEFFDDKDNSVIYCNARTAGGYRVEAVSQDGGNEFKPLSAKKLVETRGGCQGSVVSFPPPDEGQDQKPKWLLYSHPTDPDSRKDLGVYLNESPQDSTTWSEHRIINRGPSGYSDLVYMDDGWFACLMECGEKSEIEQIAVKVFSYHEVKQGIEKEEVTSCCPSCTIL
ncbi:sialidase-3-like [Channa argus]|uniref:sialidase-3-like n=1 Tax=Channa argus TaxID=215402 RepID=UPI0029444E71|nr:hypothetical protein Q8A73_011354 [Channa argus]